MDKRSNHSLTLWRKIIYVPRISMSDQFSFLHEWYIVNMNTNKIHRFSNQMRLRYDKSHLLNMRNHIKRFWVKIHALFGRLTATWCLNILNDHKFSWNPIPSDSNSNSMHTWIIFFLILIFKFFPFHVNTITLSREYMKNLFD